MYYYFFTFIPIYIYISLLFLKKAESSALNNYHVKPSYLLNFDSP